MSAHRRNSGVIPSSHPESWNELSPLRELFLQHVTEPEANQILRAASTMLYQWALEMVNVWPDHEGGVTVCQVRAAIADLRYVEGFLSHIVGTGWREGVESDRAVLLSQGAERFADELKELTDQLEALLGETADAPEGSPPDTPPPAASAPGRDGKGGASP